VYGGSKNFITGINNIIKQYKPSVIGIASTCLSETIGEDIPGHIRNFKENFEGPAKAIPTFINASTPSYCGSHAEGFHNTVLATVQTLAEHEKTDNHLTIFPGMVSPADIRYIKELLSDFGIEHFRIPIDSNRRNTCMEIGSDGKLKSCDRIRERIQQRCEQG